jgi:peroxiredoxin
LPSSIEQVHREWQGRGLVVLAINIDEPRDTVAAWVRRTRISMPVLLDPGGEVTSAYGVTATPTAFIVGRDGRLVAKVIGARPWTSEDGRALFERLLQTR